MGAWGCGPYDNDDALDWMSCVEDGVMRHIKKGLRAKHPHTVHAAAQLVMELHRKECSYTSLFCKPKSGKKSPLPVKRAQFSLYFHAGELVQMAIGAMVGKRPAYLDLGWRDEKEAAGIYSDTIRLLRALKRKLDNEGRRRRK